MESLLISSSSKTNMYSEWASLSAQISANSCGAQCFSVLNKFPASAGREVVISVVKQLGTNLGITQNAEPSHLVKDEEVSAPNIVDIVALFSWMLLTGQVVHGCHLFRPLVASARARNHQGLRQCLLRMADCFAPTATNQCSEANLRGC